MNTRSYHLRSKGDDRSVVYLNNMIIDSNSYDQIEVSVTSVNFNNLIRTLKKDDFIKINYITYLSKNERKNLNPYSWSALLSEIIFNSSVLVHVDPLSLIYFDSMSSFTITEMSYNMRLLCGLDEKDFPLESTFDDYTSRFIYKCPRFGNYNSTPIFYITSNWGANNFMQDIDGNLIGRNIFMKINNSIAANIPVVYSGGDQKRIFGTSEIGSTVEFVICDANLVKLDLLDRLYLTMRVKFMKTQPLLLNVFTREIVNPELV